MIDIQGSFYDLRAFLNSGVFDALVALTPPVSIAAGAPILDVGLAGQLRAGRQLALDRLHGARARRLRSGCGTWVT